MIIPAANQLNPITKLTGVGCAIALTFGAAGYWWATGLFCGALLLGLCWRVAGQMLRRVVGAIAPIALFLFPIHGFFHPGATALLTLGSLTLTQEGTAYAYLITSRLAALAGAILLLSLTTPPSMLIAALTQAGLPPTISYLLISPFQLIPEIQARAKTILAAQQSRGLETEGSLLQRSRALLPLVVPLVLGALVDVEERAMALEARAFRTPGRKTSLVQIPDLPFERSLRWGMVGFSAVLIGWSQWRSWNWHI